MGEQRTTIQVTKDTLSRLRKKKKGTETYESVIRRNLRSGGNPGTLTQTMAFPKEPGYKIPSLKKVREKDEIEISGKVTQVVISYPPGCNSLVDVRVLYEEPKGEIRRVIPSRKDRWIAKDDTTVSYGMKYPVKADGNIVVEWRNTDDENDHNVAGEVVIKGEEMGVV